MSKFWNGAVKLTYNTNRETKNSTDVVKFKDLITGPWNFILLSAYCTDFDWLLNQFDGIAPEVPINVIEHYDKNSEKAGIQSVTIKRSVNAGNMRTINLIHPSFPKFPSYGVMHCKLMILASDDYLRIIVSSANLMDYDYEEVQNIVFVQDLPKLRESSLTASTCSFLMNCQFFKSLNKLLELLGVFHEDKVIMPLDLMQKYDWTRVKAILVYSVPTYCRVDEDKNVSGLIMLNNICKEEPFYTKSSDEIQIEYQGSSLGTMNQNWLDDFMKASSGHLFSTTKTTSATVSSAIKRSYDDSKDVIDLTEESEGSASKHEEVVEEKVKIIFPTLRTVLNSRPGPDGFGTLFCKKKDFLSPNFPSNYFYDCTTVRSKTSSGTSASENEKCNYSMHSKIMTVSTISTSTSTTISPVVKPKYIYCGSHNFTASAWGKLTKNNTMLMVSNFEVGVILPAELWNCEYPYVRPPPKYLKSDLPWDQNDFSYRNID